LQAICERWVLTKQSFNNEIASIVIAKGAITKILSLQWQAEVWGDIAKVAASFNGGKKLVEAKEHKVGDTLTYDRGGKTKEAKIVKVGKKNGQTRYEMDNGAFVYHSDLDEAMTNESMDENNGVEDDTVNMLVRLFTQNTLSADHQIQGWLQGMTAEFRAPVIAALRNRLAEIEGMDNSDLDARLNLSQLDDISEAKDFAVISVDKAYSDLNRAMRKFSKGFDTDLEGEAKLEDIFGDFLENWDDWTRFKQAEGLNENNITESADKLAAKIEKARGEINKLLNSDDKFKNSGSQNTIDGALTKAVKALGAKSEEFDGEVSEAVSAKKLSKLAGKLSSLQGDARRLKVDKIVVNALTKAIDHLGRLENSLDEGVELDEAIDMKKLEKSIKDAISLQSDINRMMSKATGWSQSGRQVLMINSLSKVIESLMFISDEERERVIESAEPGLVSENFTNLMTIASNLVVSIAGGAPSHIKDLQKEAANNAKNLEINGQQRLVWKELAKMLKVKALSESSETSTARSFPNIVEAFKADLVSFSEVQAYVEKCLDEDSKEELMEGDEVLLAVSELLSAAATSVELTPRSVGKVLESVNSLVEAQDVTFACNEGGAVTFFVDGMLRSGEFKMDAVTVRSDEAASVQTVMDHFEGKTFAEAVNFPEALSGTDRAIMDRIRQELFQAASSASAGKRAIKDSTAAKAAGKAEKLIDDARKILFDAI